MDENLQLLVSCQNFQANDTRQNQSETGNA
ncbi:Uncharacterised protein [Klebsiella pneumoniae]|jgi:hypothetical protein|uniref:Uncharacterized protein n=1 Tax=Klebsiella michiganensis TaxID=1134687 RepID=A0ABR5G5K6_9ENTR|nr:hypothetical protein L477_05130 [Klebsiella pneumoniae BIDMC 40]ESM90304.1 hypothetical protein L378_05235 [Klebsiella pneumoniae MGH 32]EUM73880.1 hypothetical protein L353_08884 [Enterobacter sp. MGH 7]EWF57006.1 hypothetical protein L387_05845 [Klebsiella michiganensis]KMH46471.1 hypothetical protein SM73_04703 [Klebsiella quasipneumoniae]KMI73971.1 hypothetical protein SM98_04792 [Klebsiella pneumoniae]SAD13011.1 Uncharacterised protein [Enterobacter hormaechei]SAS76733.1 Uncharacteri